MAWPENVDKTQLRIEYFRGSGAGGQKRNKTSSACRITHLPTGKVSACEAGRQQTKNREEAFRKLADQLVPEMKLAARRGPEDGISKERIRSYNEKRGDVYDHRTGKSYSFAQVLNGELSRVHRDLMSLKGTRAGL